MKRRVPFGAYSQFWLPASDLDINKQEQFTPSSERELSELLALMSEYLPVFELRETRAESSSIIKSKWEYAQFVG